MCSQAEHLTTALEKEMNLKAGYKTTEFWMSLMAVVSAVAVGVGLVPTEGPWAKAVGLLAGVLTAYGYTYARAKAKAP